MKELFSIFEKDYREENFSVKEWIVFGVIVPIVLLAIMGIAGWMDSLSGVGV